MTSLNSVNVNMAAVLQSIYTIISEGRNAQTWWRYKLEFLQGFTVGMAELPTIKSVFPREKGVNWNPWHLNDVGSGFDFFLIKDNRNVLIFPFKSISPQFAAVEVGAAI